MDAQQSKRSERERDIDTLAQESKVSIAEVEQLYNDEQAKLEVGARVSSFITIFTIRHVREKLRQRRAEKRASTTQGRDLLAK